MNRNNCKYKKVYIYSCKNFLIAIIVLQDLWEWSCSCLFLNFVDSVLNTEKLHMNLYERCLGPCGGVEHSKNYLAEPQLARIYVTVVTSFLFSWCRILWIKKSAAELLKTEGKETVLLARIHTDLHTGIKITRFWSGYLPVRFFSCAVNIHKNAGHTWTHTHAQMETWNSEFLTQYSWGNCALW